MQVILKNFAFVAIGVLLTNAQAAPCDDNFSNSGGFLQGNTYKSFADVPGISPSIAFDGELTDISTEPSWKILSSNKSTGDIQAVNAASYAKGKSIPFNVHIDALSNGAKISVSYATPAGMSSPEGAIKAQFCKTIAAAATATGQQSASNTTAAASAPVPVTPRADAQLATTADQPSSTAHTSEYKKNGMPCVAELCIGDGIAELRKIKWDLDPIFESLRRRSTPQMDLTMIQPLYRGDLESVSSYLYHNKFDAAFLAQAHKVVATCRWSIQSTVVGKFTSKNGNPTRVGIRQLPTDNSNKTQKWVVDSISREFPQVVSEKQASEVAKEMQERYSGYGRLIIGNASGLKSGEVGVNINGREIGFALWVGSEMGERLKFHPACGGTTKVNVD